MRDKKRKEPRSSAGTQVSTNSRLIVKEKTETVSVTDPYSQPGQRARCSIYGTKNPRAFLSRI